MGSLLRRNCHLINPCHVCRSLQNQRNQLRLLSHHCQRYHHPYPRSCRSCHPPSSRSRIHWKRHHLRMGKDQGNWNRKQHTPNHPPMGRTPNPFRSNLQISLGRSSITPQSICVGSSSAGTGACNGDSGGPMVQTDANGVTWLIGNTSWGASSCDASSYPTIYSKNSAVADWIQQQL